MTYADYSKLDNSHKKEYIRQYASNKIGNVYFCDEVRRLYADRIGMIIKYDDIKKVVAQPDVHVYDTTKTVDKSNVGKSVAGALIGGALAGGVGTVAGAVVGANGKRTKTETETHYDTVGGYVIITNSNGEEFCIYSGVGADRYTVAKHIARAIKSVMSGEASKVTPPMTEDEKQTMGCVIGFLIGIGIVFWLLNLIL